jgi:hypothetical protein
VIGGGHGEAAAVIADSVNCSLQSWCCFSSKIVII